MIRAAALAAAALLAAPAAGQDVAITLAPGEVLLNVQAEGIHLARPDVMVVRAGVVTTGRTAREALAANSALANRMLDAVRANGVEPRDVETAELAVAPQFDESDRERAGDEDREPRIVGYIARNMLRLRLRDLAKGGAIVDALFTAGANKVDGPYFGISQARTKPVLRESRRAAVAEALEEATTYADALNMRVSRVLRVSERSSFEADEMDENTIVVTGSRVRPTPVEPGEIEVETQVWIDYALVPR